MTAPPHPDSPSLRSAPVLSTEASGNASLLLTVADAAGWLASSGVIEGAIRRGEMIPDFELENTSGNRVSLQTLLDHGPVVIVFTLGHGSPLCRRTLCDLQAGVDEIVRLGASIVAVTPDLPATSQALRHREGLGFDLLADDVGRLAALFGIAYAPPLAAADWLALLGLEPGVEWPTRDVLLPAAFLVTPDGIAQMAFVPDDPLRRISCAQVLGALSTLPPMPGPDRNLPAPRLPARRWLDGVLNRLRLSLRLRIASGLFRARPGKGAGGTHEGADGG